VTDQPTPNVTLLRYYAAWVEHQSMLPVEQQEWDQGVYGADVDAVNAVTETEEYRDPNVCQTTHCIAGRVAIDHGWVFLNQDASEEAARDYPSWVGRQSDGNVPRQVEEVAAEILGLDINEANKLFAAHNDAITVQQVVDRIISDAERGD
jgi:hypothetical protein